MQNNQLFILLVAILLILTVRAYSIYTPEDFIVETKDSQVAVKSIAAFVGMSLVSGVVASM
ncbi:NAD kinase [Acrasis kona]|uniref:NAD kinase n=1 Tax=Acrasis kona TaxID=1008807 RepID=A0AAW2ZKW7_9EUKA